LSSHRHWGPPLRPAACLAAPGVATGAKIPFPGKMIEILPMPAWIVYAKKVCNNTDGSLPALILSIYPNGPDGVSVPLIEIGAQVILVVSLATVAHRISRRRRTHKQAVADSWEAVATADLAVHFYTVLGFVDLFVAFLTLVFMCLPIVHSGAFVTSVYAVRGTLDNVPWMCCLYRRKPNRGAMVRAAALLSLFAIVRVLVVLQKTPVTAYLFSFAPTDASMLCNAGFGCLYAVLFCLTYCSGVAGPLLRPECRDWLMLLAVSYCGSSAGYLLFEGFFVNGQDGAISATSAMWIAEAFLYIYVLAIGPVLYLTFRRERAFWRGSSRVVSVSHRAAGSPQHTERLLDDVAAVGTPRPLPFAPKRVDATAPVR